MNKIKLIYTFLIFLSISFFLVSCDDAKEDNLTPNKVYFVHSGVQELKMYNKGGSTSYTYNLDLYKSGFLESGASAKIAIMSDEELALYNEENGTSFELISPEVYEISKFEVSFSPDQKDVNRIINIDFDPAKLAASATNKVLPIKIIDASIDVNKDKSYCIIHPQTYDPQFALENPQEKIVSYVKGAQSVLEYDIPIALDIDTNISAIDLELEIDTDFIDQYNLSNNEDYIVPDANAFSFVKNQTLEAGKKNIIFNVKIFQQYLTKNYMLPVRLKSSSKFGVDNEQYFVLMLNVQSELLDKTKWTIAGFSSEEATGESGGANGKAIYIIDGNNSTFWHSQWQGAKPQPPHWLIIDMHGSYTITEIILRQRGSGDSAPTKGGEFDLCDEYNSSSPSTAAWRKIGDFQLAAIVDDQSFNIKKAKGRYLRIYITEVRSGDKTTSLAEISARGY